MIELRVVTVAGDPDKEPELAAALGRRDGVELVMRCMDRVELLAVLRGADLDAVVTVGAPAWLDRQCAAEAAEHGVRLVAFTSIEGELERLKSLGAVVLRADASVDELLESCRSGETGAPASVVSGRAPLPKGKLVAVWGPKGAPGRTTVAIELAAELAAHEPETVLVDADPYGGDILQLLAVVDELPTIVWAARMAVKDELDAARLTIDLNRVGKHGPCLLPGLPRAELWPDVSGYAWQRLLDILRATYVFTVCDVGFCLEPASDAYAGPSGGRNALTRITIADADHVVAVCRADAVGTKNFLWAFEELKGLTRGDDVVIVANRVRAAKERELGDIFRRHLGKRPIAYIRDAQNDVERAISAGAPVRTVAPSSDVAAATRLIAAAVGGRIPARGLMARLAAR